MENITNASSNNEVCLPNVNFDTEKGICEIIGESFLDGHEKFYSNYLNMVDEYLAKKNDLTINFKLTYFNTTSSKRIHEILKHVKEYIEKGKKIETNWYIYDNDEDIKMEVEDFSTMTGIEIKTFDATN